MSPEIRVLNGSLVRNRDFEGILQSLQDIFSVPVSIGPVTLDFARAFDQSRNQTNSTVLLAQMLAGQPAISQKRIAVIDVDLFIPILTFVFGEAQLNGSAAIVSTHRLTNQFYGLPRNERLMLQRLEKEIVHELGHTFGLYHCHQFECVMRSSTYVEDIDLKRPFPCSGCAALIQHPALRELRL